MGATQKTYTGKDAEIAFYSGSTAYDSDALAIADASLTLDLGTVEQELVGENGNYYTQGALSCEGSLTAAKMGSGSTGLFVGAMVNGFQVASSGSTASSSGLKWYFKSCQVTGFDLSMGDSSTLTEGSIDFVVMDPYNIEVNKETNGMTKLND
jgi:hypothetical protein